VTNDNKYTLNDDKLNYAFLLVELFFLLHTYRVVQKSEASGCIFLLVPARGTGIKQKSKNMHCPRFFGPL